MAFTQIIVLIISYLFMTTWCIEKLEICQKCDCFEKHTESITLNCTEKHLDNFFSKWPLNYTNITMIFTRNHFQNLTKLPPTNATLQILLSNCQIEFLTPGVFNSLPQIKFIDLSYNSLTTEGLPPNTFKGSIEELDLSYNQIHSLNKKVFAFLPQLKRLNLEGNDFKVLDTQTQLALSKIPNLVGLNLANNELTELIPNAIKHFRNLTELDLSKNNLDFVPYSLKFLNESLQVLIIDSNPIFEMNSDTFSGMSNLVEISANNLTYLKCINASTFLPTKKLLKLSLCNNIALEDINPAAFSVNSTLKELYLNNNNLNGISFKLLDWSKLDIFQFSDNPLVCSCDLYNISIALSRDIRRTLKSPTCLHPTTIRPYQIYSLKSDICKAKISTMKISYHHFSIPLAGLVTTLTIAFIIAISLARQRYKKFIGKKRRNDPFVSQVIYSPLLNAARA